MKKGSNAGKPSAEKLKGVAGAVLIILLLPLLVLNLVVISGGDLPVFGNSSFCLCSGNVGGYSVGDMLVLDAEKTPDVGDVAVFKHGNRYAVGTVSAVVDGKNGRTAAISIGEDRTAAVSIDEISGTVKKSLGWTGKLVSFLGKYEIAFLILAVSIAVIELADIFVNIRKSAKQAL